MLTLELKARDWYEWLEPKSLFSLRDKNQVFYEKYRDNPSSLSWTTNCCDQSQNIIQYLLYIDEDLVNMHHDFHKNLDESVEEEINQGMKDIPASINNDSSC